MAKFWLSQSKQFKRYRPIRRTQCCRNKLVQKPRARLSRRKERDLAVQRTARANTARFRRFHVKADSLPPAAARSGYGCKPAARLTRSASLLMTNTDIDCASRQMVHQP